MSGSRLIPLAEHPRAAPKIKRAKAWGGLWGFGIATFVGLSHGAPLEATLGRALVGGVLAYLCVWAAAVAIYKRVLVAEALRAAKLARERRESAAE
jgi:hypothetical protein